MKILEKVATGNDRTRVSVALYEIGPDLLAVIGGEGEHIGATSLAEVTPDELRAETLSALGHREAELTEEFCRSVCSATGRRVVAVAGIHLDDITRDEIDAVRRNVAESTSRVISALTRR